MNDTEMTNAEFSAWIDESIHSLAVLAELDIELAGREATLRAQAQELIGQLGDTSIHSPEELEQALAALPAQDLSATLTPTAYLSQGKRRLVTKV